MFPEIDLSPYLQVKRSFFFLKVSVPVTFLVIIIQLKKATTTKKNPTRPTL